VTEESGSEEILYPRVQPILDSKKLDQTPRAAVSQGQPAVVSTLSPTSAQALEPTTPPTSDAAPPPSSFAPQPKAKKRTSDEFLMDHVSGVLVSKSASVNADTSPASSTPNAATTVRKHRSLGASATTASARLKDRRRGASSGTVLDLNVVTTPKSQASGPGHTGKHSRHASASASASTSSSSDAPSRRTLNHTHADFSHLPPSPSSSSIHPFLRTNPNPVPAAIANANASTTPCPNPASTGVVTPPAHMSPSVAHSLLRGTQEGWSALDDQETVEALRKLDGISGKTVHARSSVSLGGSKSGSRPGTPGRSAATTQWEGIEGKEKSKRQSVVSTKGSEDAKSRRSSAGSGKDRIEQETQSDVAQETSDSRISPRAQAHVVEDSAQLSPSASTLVTPGRTGRRPGSKDGPTNARSSFTPKRGSASSTSFTGTPTTSSRDSTTFSTSTSATSAISVRSSFSKNRRNSAGSDVSSVHSSDATSLRDRAASLASHGIEVVEDEPVPPVPPLPKDLAPYKSPLPSSTNLTFPVVSPAVDDPDRTVSLDVPPISSPTKPAAAAPPVASAPQPIRTPSKKWSFSSALNLKLQSSATRDSRQLGTSASSIPPERPISFAYTTDSVGYPEPPLSATSSSHTMTEASWSITSTDADALTARSSMSSLRVPMSPSSTSPGGHRNRNRSPSLTSSRTPERPGTASSTSTHTTGQPPLSPRSHQPQSSRLTPSAIPFFRRSSSQSLYQQPQSSSSWTFPSAPNSATNLPVDAAAVASPPSTKDASQTPLSPTKKSSVFGLPSLLKGSSSKRSLQAQADKDREREREREEKRERQLEKERERQQRKEDDKDRSESRISVLMGRKRGKVRHLSNATRFTLISLCFRDRLFLLQSRESLSWCHCLQCKCQPSRLRLRSV
jgi:dual specificity tyrosine-phosphorylation-regulated kinase 2/3/4